MTNIDLLKNKVSHVKKYLSALKSFHKYSAKQLADEPVLNGALKWYLYLTVQSTIDLAEAIVAHKNLRKPSTYRENFEILEEEKIISRSLTEKLMKMTGFRNFIVHDYEKMSFEIIYDVLHKSHKDIENFIRIISKKFF